MSLFGRKNKKQIEVATKTEKTIVPEEKLESEMYAKPTSLQIQFQSWLQSVHNMGNQNLTIEEQRKRMNDYLNKLSEEVYTSFFPQIVSIIQKSKEKCKAFKNSEEQVDNILSWLPRLEDHKELLLLYIKERRKKYRLVV